MHSHCYLQIAPIMKAAPIFQLACINLLRAVLMNFDCVRPAAGLLSDEMKF